MVGVLALGQGLEWAAWLVCLGTDSWWLRVCSSVRLGLFAMDWCGGGDRDVGRTLFYSSSGTRDLSLFGLVLPLLLILRLPLGFDQLLVLKLQRITTTLSSVVLDLVGLPHAVNNNVIQLSTRELFVAEACSGIQSVFTLMFLAVTIVVMNRRVLWIAPLFILVSNVLAVATNVVRVCVIAMADVWGGIDLTKGWPHELVGYGALTIGILFLLSFDQLIHTLLHPIKADSGGRNPLVRLWNAIVGGEYDEDIDHDRPKQA